MLWLDHVRSGIVKFPKSWLWTLACRQKIHHFFFSHTWDTRFKYLLKLCPHMLIYSASHIMQWFSHILNVFTPKIRRNVFDLYIIWIKTNVAYTRLEVIARTKYCTTTTASNWFVTLYCKLLPAVSSSPKHCRWRSRLYYTLYICSLCQRLGITRSVRNKPRERSASIERRWRKRLCEAKPHLLSPLHHEGANVFNK